MFFFYYPYVLILSGLILFDCFRRKQPLWWGAMVLLAPVTVPYFIFKTRKGEGIVLFMVFLASFSFVVGIEFYTWAREVEAKKYTNLPPITRQTIRFSEVLKQTTMDLDQALIKLEELSKVESRITEIKATIEFIENLRDIIDRNRNAIDRFVKFINDYKSYFVKNQLNWVYHIQEFYTSREVILHFNSLGDYLDNFETLLKYTYENFDGISEAKTAATLKNYDEYYIRYRRAVDRHNKFNVLRIEFQNEFLHKFPEVKPYLPGSRQTETFRLWK